MKHTHTAAFLVVTSLATLSTEANAFCGFFVAKADAKLFNKASQVVVVRDEDKTVLTMANDFQGKVKDFAMVIPVPTSIEREQIHIGDMKHIDHLDAFTGPRLVEYHDENPCDMRRYEMEDRMPSAPAMESGGAPMKRKGAGELGVTIEASYTVGEYDILILSAKQSDGLVIWLKQEGYKLPSGAEPVIDSYLKQKMKWFVAKVNLKEHDKMGGGKLRPIQVAYESPKFMLPIRLGTVNADGTQDLIAYVLTKGGRVETTNYRTVKLPSDVNVPEYTKDVFGEFYKATFARTVEKNDGRAVILEYAWDMGWCDPCAADPLSAEELKGLGVWWAGQSDGSGAQNAYVSRLHARYDRAHFPEDLVFQATNNRENFQGRYIMQHPYKGEMTCDAAGPYLEGVWKRQQQEAKTLADLTGWKMEDIKSRMKLADSPPKSGKKKWYQNIWK
jgi:hypothetical protein